MSTDLLFAPPAPQNATGSVQPNSPAKPAKSERSDLSGADRDSSNHEPNTFLSTLKTVSREQQSRSPEIAAGDQRSVEKRVSGDDDVADEAQFPLFVSIDPNLPDIPAADPLGLESNLDLKTFLNVLSELGGSAGGGESGIHPAIKIDLADSGQLAAIQKWIAQLEQNPASLTADLKMVVERIQQAIAEAINAKGAVTMTIGGNAGQDIDPGRLPETSPEKVVFKEVNTVAPDQKSVGGSNDGIAASSPSASSPRAPETTPTDTQTATATAAKSSDTNKVTSNPENQRSNSDVTGSLPPDGRSPGETVKTTDQTTGTIRAASTDGRPGSGLADSNPAVAPDPPRAGNTSAENENGKMPARADLTAERSDGTRYASPSSQATDVQLNSTAGEEPVSKLFQETQVARGGVNRIEVDLNDEPVAKVVKSEAAAGDHSPLNSSGQNAEKSPDTAPPAAKDPVAGQGLNRNQTLDQIVRRASIFLRNGQQEARIDLKPDFLGHVRMQVISGNQQVTVKILAEHGFVKDMIENNLHQLKADLQHQGLEVDKVEVSVSQDSEEGASHRNRLAQFRNRQGAAHRRDEQQPAEDHEKESRPKPRSADSSATIDYFA